MSEYLFVGGPANGQTREVEDDGAIANFVQLPDAADFGTLSGRAQGAVIHRYVRRELRANDNRDGSTWFRTLYVHESVPDAGRMYQELAGWLVGNWILGGAQIHDGDLITAEVERRNANG